MKRFRNVPAVVTLLAGFIVSVIMIIQGYSLSDFLWILILTMVGFFIASLIFCILLNLLFDYTDKKQEAIRKAKEEEEAAQAKTDEQATEDVTDKAEQKK